MRHQATHATIFQDGRIVLLCDRKKLASAHCVADTPDAVTCGNCERIIWKKGL